jgi:hypothetical protein
MLFNRFNLLIFISTFQFLFFIQPLKAEFFKDYNDLKKTENFSEPAVVAMVDETTGKGGGVFTWKPYDTSEEIFGLVVSCSNSQFKGNWIRQQSNLNPDWFGAINKKELPGNISPTFRALGYSDSTIKSRYANLIPDISLDDTPDWAALQFMCKLQEKGWLSIELNPLDYFINRTVVLAENTKPSFEITFQIEGSGARIYSINKNGFPYFYSMPKTQKISQDVFCARRFHISNLNLRGSAKSGSGSVGISIGGTFHSLIENIQIHSMDTGIVLRHAMSSEIYRCNAVGCYNVSFFLGSGNKIWEGATPPTSGSNQSRIIASRTFPAENQFAGCVIHQSSECRVVDFTLDGGGKRSVDYAVIINTGGTTTVKDGYVEGLHGETNCDSALIKFRGNGASIFVAKDLYIQMKSVIIELDAMSSSAQVTCENFSYMPAGSTFANKGNGAWDFKNIFSKDKNPEWKTSDGYNSPQKEKIRNVRKLQ